MTNEELEREIKRLEEQIEDQINSLRIKFLESKADKKPYEVEAPENIRNYYTLDEYGEVYDLEGFTRDYIEYHYRSGLAFKTREEAEKYYKERILLFKFYKWAEEHNGGWTPNWKDLDEEKWVAMYDNKYEFFEIYESRRYLKLLKLPYFKSEEIAKQFIEEFGDEIKEVLC